jgi:organic hydroperoxide reductase OsmC/OhrA
VAEYVANVTWERAGARFTDNRYSRRHRWEFDGGLSVPASASPHVVPASLADPGAVDPEEAFVAALSSCHMLWFLSIAAKRGIVINRYRDEAVGYLEKNEDGRLAMTRVVLRPRIDFSGDRMPTLNETDEMHEQAHHACFIATSVRSTVSVEPHRSGE